MGLSIGGLGDWFKKRLDDAQGAYHQVNFVDNNRTFDTNRRGVQVAGPDRSIAGNLSHNGATNAAGNYLFKPIGNTVQKSGNTIAALGAGIIGLGNAGVQSVFGSDQGYQNTLDSTQSAIDELLGRGWGNKGSYLTPQQARGQGGVVNDLIKPIAQGAVEIAPLVVPALPKTGGVIARAATGAAENAATGLITTGAQQAINGDFNPRQLAQNTLISAGVGAAVPIAGAAARQGVRVASNAAPVIAQRTAQMAGDQSGSIKIPGSSKMATPETPQVRVQAADQGPGVVVSRSDSANPFTPPTINKTKYNVPEKTQAELDVLAKELTPDIQQKVGRRLSLEEIKQTADATGSVLTNPRNREATLNYSAALLNAREELGALIQKRTSGTINPEETIRLNQAYAKVKMAAADAGRTLNAFKEVANPAERQVIDVMIDRILKTGAKLDDVQAALGKIDSTNPKQIAGFYRQFVKATSEDWLDKFRYTNMLSSPLTHIVNLTSNAQGVLGVAPMQKFYEGGVDALRSVVTGGPRTRFAGEAGSYVSGAVKAVPDAWQQAMGVLKGKELMGNPDFDSLRNIPLATQGAAGIVDKILTVVPKFLEASDQFGMTVARGGEKAALVKRGNRGVKVDINPENIFKVTDDSAKYRVFRQELGKQGQGHLLEMIDQVPQTVSKMRQSSNPYVRNIAKFTFPFVATPTNIFKQGIEYSPAGVFTLHGAADKTAQAAKMLMGTTATSLVAGTLAAGGDLTFNEPTDPEQRNAFRAEGKQPYAFRIPGTDKWIGYSKLHPAIAFNLATVAAVKDSLDKGDIDQSTADKIMGVASGVMGYFRDQSYMKSVGDLTSIMQAKDGAKLGDIVANQASNTLNQFAPFKSMTSWIGRMVDPTQRKIDYDASTPQQIYQNIVKDIPGLNSAVSARENPYTGEPLTNDHPLLNSFSPLRVTDDRGFGNTTGLNIDQRQINRDLPLDQREPFRRGVIQDKAQTKQLAQEKDLIKKGKGGTGIKVQSGGVKVGNSDIKQLSSGEFYTKVGGEYKSFKSREKAEQAVFVDKFRAGGKKIQEFGDKVYLKADNEQGYTSLAKGQYEFNQADSKITLAMDRAKASNNLEQWFKAADSKISAMDKLRKSYDPETESDKIADITLKMENLLEQADKYEGYGGFTKGSKGKKNGGLPSINVGVSSDLSGPVVTKGSYQAPRVALKNKGTPSVRVKSRRGVTLKAPKKLAKA